MSTVPQWIKPSRSTTLSRSFPGLCPRRIITAPILLGLIICTEAPYLGQVDLLLSCYRVLIFLLGLSSPDATYPISAATQLMCHTEHEHARSTDIAREPFPDGTSPAHMDRHPWHNASMICQIFPDPPSRFMNTTHQGLCQSPPPPLSLSESTRRPASVKTKRSLQSLTSSEDHTAVSSHADTGSWYLHGYPQAGWNPSLALDQQNEKKVGPGGKEVGGKSELPMHYIPASRLRKRKRRSCSDMLWGTMVSAGRAIASVFKTDSVPPPADKL
jgi:hypothetical protein